VQAPKRIHVIACGVLAVDLKAAAERLGLDVSTQFLPGGLHSTPQELRRRLQEAIDQASAARLGDVLAIGYGVCGLGTVGIHARNLPLVLPRVQDCIALFLGSDAAYREQFARCPGTYYISAGWVEEKAQPQSATARGPEASPQQRQEELERLTAKYGRENAEAIRYFLTSWQRNYRRAAFIDTGVGAARGKYAEIARAMADEFGWEYEQVRGTGELLDKLLTAQGSNDEVLVVPPHHVTVFDAVTRGLKAVPVWEGDDERVGRARTLVLEGDGPGEPAAGPVVRTGLGIDAGGTYTDAVLFDFPADRTLGKAKALTTKWDLRVGIDEALDGLDGEALRRVELVSISTTLATNAIVEGRGQKVGLLILPPYGLFEPSDIAHRPIAVLDGRLEIDGAEIAPIDPDQVRRVARRMVDEQEVASFAVAGFASHNNPAHELGVQRIVRAETGLTVTCGHEVSEGLNYRVRAATAALNARIIPCLAALLEEVRASLRRRGIRAATMVVRSDGSLMSVPAALERPIETILSGPAASVAGASHLAGCDDAVVVDVGGTTTDTAVIEGGAVRTCDEGASVGGWRTHVRALDMRTLGLGGDSHVVRENARLTVGPRRVAPVCWLAARHAGTAEALDWVERHLDYFHATTRGMDLLSVNGHPHALALTDDERRIVALLSERPHSAAELAGRLGAVAWRFLPLGRLEEAHVVQRAGLTPTDLLHVTGAVALWDANAARRACALTARLAGTDAETFARRTLGDVVRRLAAELLKKQLDGQVDPDEMDRSPVAAALVDNCFDGGSDRLRVRVQLRRPVVGIGAPVHCFLPQAAKLLETEAVVPPHADVANAIGAVTSQVRIRRQVRIVPNDRGRYSLYGLPDAPSFADFDAAHDYAVAHLPRIVRDLARAAGTRQTAVEIVYEDRLASTADGGQLFIGRTVEARLAGRPDVARIAADT